MAAIAITEEFNDPTGQYRYLDAGDLLLLDELQGRQHVDLRSFYTDEIVVPLFMYDLTLTTTELDLLEMSELEGTRVLRPGESWTAGATGPDTSLLRRNTLRWTLSVGANVTESVGEAVDLSGVPLGELVVTFTSFPGASLNLAASSLELEDADNLVSLPFTGATATNGAQAVSWPVAALGVVTKPTTVRLILTATAGVSVVVGHIRMLAPTWTPTKLDQDTITQRLIPIFSREGDTPGTIFPKVWRAAEPPGDDDPLPMDSRMAINFYTGEMTYDNKIVLFLRGRREDFLTQLDLDGSDELNADGTPLFGDNQGTLEARGHQPDYGTAVYNPRVQADLETFNQTGLNTQVQAELERVSDTISEAWIEITLDFGTVNQVTVGTTETLNDDDRFLFTVSGLVPQTQYLFTSDLEADTLHCRIYPLEAEGAIDLDNAIFDSGLMVNDFLFKRRKGRIGWEIVLADGDARVESIRSRGLNFGEIITNNFESFTPVEGARLYTGATPSTRVPTLATSFNEATITVDNYNSRSTDGSFKVQSIPLSGIQTNANAYEDFEHMKISFDLYYPSGALLADQYLLAALLNERGYMIPLTLPTLNGDQWQTVTIRPTRAIKEQSGLYRFVLMQSSGEATWWIDNLDIVQRTVAWSGRATYDDPWNRNDNWSDFLDLTDSEVDGIVFSERGFWTQVRGKTLTQGASIDKVYIKPKYAELGRMIWSSDEEIINSIPAIRPPAQVTFDATPHGEAYDAFLEPMYYHEAGAELTFTGALRADGVPRTIVEWYWDFGDGTTAVGQVVAHTYLVANLSTVAHLRATEDNGRVSYASMNMMLTPPPPSSFTYDYTLPHSYIVYPIHFEVVEPGDVAVSNDSTGAGVSLELDKDTPFTFMTSNSGLGWHFGLPATTLAVGEYTLKLQNPFGTVLIPDPVDGTFVISLSNGIVLAGPPTEGAPIIIP